MYFFFLLELFFVGAETEAVVFVQKLVGIIDQLVKVRPSLLDDVVFADLGPWSLPRVRWPDIEIIEGEVVEILLSNLKRGRRGGSDVTLSFDRVYSLGGGRLG